MPDSDPAPSAELVEAEAWAQMQLARDEASRARLGIVVHRHGGAAAIGARGCLELSVNRVFALGIGTPATCERIDEIVREYLDAGVTKFIVQLTPDSSPRELREWLLERGFVRRGGLLKLARTTDDDGTLVTRGDVRVVEVWSADGKLFDEIVGAPLQVPPPMRAGLSAAVGQPGWRFYLAYLGARPIAGAAMFTGRRAAWFGLTATLSTERRRGAQTALLVRRIRDAREAGCRWATAETLPERGDQPNPSLRNMRRLGFDVLYEREVHVYGL